MTLDFTAAQYLGLCHPLGSLPGGLRLTTGVPAALQEPLLARGVAARIAALQGCEAGVVGPSSLHLLMDLLRMFAQEGRPLVLDSGAYTIACDAATHAKGLRAVVVRCKHYDVSVARLLARRHTGGPGPIFIVDGWCPGCGRVAPIRGLAAVAASCGGRLVIDDTQALGVLGRRTSRSPFGIGGGGALRWSGTTAGGIIVVASLAKAFGAPLAILSGPSYDIERFRAAADLRAHCSPPSNAALAAAARALAMNATTGQALRRSLSHRVLLFRTLLARRGVPLVGTLPFPVVSIPLAGQRTARRVQRNLRTLGIEAVVHVAQCGSGVHLSLFVSARHDPRMLVRTANALSSALC